MDSTHFYLNYGCKSNQDVLRGLFFSFWTIHPAVIWSQLTQNYHFFIKWVHEVCWRENMFFSSYIYNTHPMGKNCYIFLPIWRWLQVLRTLPHLFWKTLSQEGADSRFRSGRAGESSIALKQWMFLAGFPGNIWEMWFLSEISFQTNPWWPSRKQQTNHLEHYHLVLISAMET